MKIELILNQKELDVLYYFIYVKKPCTTCLSCEGSCNRLETYNNMCKIAKDLHLDALIKEIKAYQELKKNIEEIDLKIERFINHKNLLDNDFKLICDNLPSEFSNLIENHLHIDSIIEKLKNYEELNIARVSFENKIAELIKEKNDLEKEFNVISNFLPLNLKRLVD